MADDILGQLGLDVTSFIKATQQAAAQERYLQQQSKELDAVIKTLERDMRNAGTATGAQVAQLGQLRQALKGVQGDLKAVQGEQKAFNAAIGNSPEEVKARDKAQKDAAKIADKRKRAEEQDASQKEGAINKFLNSTLGFSITIGGAVLALQRFGKAVLDFGQNTLAQAAKLGGSQRFQDIEKAGGNGAAVSLGLSAQTSQFLETFKAKAVGSAASTVNAKVSKYKAIGDTINDYLKGFQKNLTGSMSGPAWDDFNRNVKAIQDTLSKGGELGESLSPEWLAKINERTKNNAEETEKRGQKILDQRKSILATENGIAAAQAIQTSDASDKTQILEAELKLNNQLLEIFESEDTFDRQGANQAKARIGDLKRELEIRAADKEMRLNSASVETDAMKLTRDGYARIAELARLRNEYDNASLVARREGNLLLASELQTQKQIATVGLRVAEHNLTTRERLAERKTARKFARDTKKVEGDENDREPDSLLHDFDKKMPPPTKLPPLPKRDKWFFGDDKGTTRGNKSDLEKSLENAGVENQSDLDRAIKEGRITPGSRLDRFARQKFTTDKADDRFQTQLKSITVSTMNVQTFNVALK